MDTATKDKGCRTIHILHDVLLLEEQLQMDDLDDSGTYTKESQNRTHLDGKSKFSDPYRHENMDII